MEKSTAHCWAVQMDERKVGLSAELWDTLTADYSASHSAQMTAALTAYSSALPTAASMAVPWADVMADSMGAHLVGKRAEPLVVRMVNP